MQHILLFLQIAELLQRGCFPLYLNVKLIPTVIPTKVSPVKNDDKINTFLLFFLILLNLMNS